MPLGRDGTAVALARFGGRLQSATLTRPGDDGEIDPGDPTAAPDGDDEEYDCEGYAFNYELRDIDETRIMKGDYKVTILRGSLAVLPEPGDSVNIPPPGSDTPASATVIRVESVTEAAVTVQVRG